MLKIGPMPQPRIQQQPCCHDGQCHMCKQSIESDKFEKLSVSKPSLKKVVPVSFVCGLAGAGAVLGASAILDKITRSKNVMVSGIAVATGLGIGNSVMMHMLSKGKNEG